MRVERRLAAILAADVVGYSRLMEADEAGTYAALTARRKTVLDPLVKTHKGRIIKLMGDGALVEFASAVNAVQCAAALQRGMAAANANLPEDRRIVLRVGVNLGDVIVEGDDLYGDGVNLAARLQALAEPGAVYVSQAVAEQTRGKLDVRFEDLGERTLKNIAQPARIFRMAAGGEASEPDGLSLPDRPSIAVLPFTNMSGDPEQEYFSDGITEDIITELSRFRSLFVIARNSSFHYKGKSPKVQEIGRELGVQYIVEGSVRKAGSQVRVTAQLIEAATGNHLWAERYDRELSDIFAVQDELVQAIATAVPGRLDEAATERARRKPSESLTAYDYLLRAGPFQSANMSSADALVLLEKAVEIDPHFARAYCELAAHHAYSVFAHGTSVQEAVRQSRYFAEKALGCAPSDAQVNATAAIAYIMVGEHDFARRHIERAIAQNPNDINVLRNSAAIYAYLGDHEAAMKWHDRHLRREPLFPDRTREILFDTYYMARRYDDAISLFRSWRKPPVHMYCELAAACGQLGRMEEARAAIAEFERMKPPDYDFTQVARAHARMCARQEDADRWLEGYRKAGLPV